MKFFYNLILLIFVLNVCAKSNAGSVQQGSFNTILSISTGINPGVVYGDFFDVYKSELGGTKDELSLSPNFSIGLKLLLTEKFRYGVVVEFFNAKMLDYYVQNVPTDEGIAKRQISQDFSLNSMPIMITGEYVPYTNKQFKSYCGLGLGTSINNLNWEESINSTISNDKRAGGNNFGDVYFSPAIRVFGAVELGFDKNPYKNFLGSLILELRYTHFFESINIFEKLKSQYNVFPELLNQNYSFINGYFSFNIAVTFNFHLKRKIPSAEQ